MGDKIEERVIDMGGLKVLTGLTPAGYVWVTFDDGTNELRYNTNAWAYKVSYTKGGAYITIKGKKYYIEILKGSWDNSGYTRYGVSQWIRES